MNKNIHTFIGCDNEYDESKIVIFGAPFDGTTSYRPGTRFASAAMRNESIGIETYSPYLDKDLEDYNIFDGGDLEFVFGNPAKNIEIIKEYTASILKDNKIPAMIGGEHLVTLGAVQAVFEKYNDLHIIHFDAHADLRQDYLGEKLSHATVIRRVWEIVGDNKIYQFGIRSGEKNEFLFAKDHTYMNKSVFPGTGTPEAGGITFKELINAVMMFQKLENIVAFDINELAPMLDSSGASTACACKVLREMLLVTSK